jgi:hypothetical protein
LISTRIIPANEGCLYKLDVEDDEEFTIRTTNVIGGYVNVYKSSGDHKYQYLNRIDTGKEFTYQKDHDYYVVVTSISSAFAAVEVSIDSKGGIPLWVLILVIGL